MPRQNNTGDGWQDIEAFRLTAKAKETVAVGEIFRADPLLRKGRCPS
jgi:hypothetical protein